MNRKKVLLLVLIFTTVILSLLIASNLSKKYNTYSVSESSWNSLIKQRKENTNFILKDIEFNDYKLIVDNSKSEIYYSVVNDSKNKYNPSVKFFANKQNVKLAILADEITDEKIKNNYKFKLMIYDENQYHVYNLICTDLPTINIRYKENKGNKQNNIPMDIFVFNNLSNTPNRITVSNGKLRMENNYFTFSLNMLTPGKNRRENKISILNMKPNSEYILTPVTNSLDEDSKNQDQAPQTPKSNRIELFINNKYLGTYNLGYKQE